MNLLSTISNIFKRKTYDIIPLTDQNKDVVIKHHTGVEVAICSDGSVIISSPKNLGLHADGNLYMSSNTHIGLSAPRIDLN